MIRCGGNCSPALPAAGHAPRPASPTELPPGRVARARTRPERRRGRQPERGQGGVPGGVGAALL